MSNKTVFVTVGTTKFDDLITTVLNRTVLEVAQNLTIIQFNYSRVMLIDHFAVQCISEVHTIL